MHNIDSVQALLKKLEYWEKNPINSMHYKGCNIEQWTLLHVDYLKNKLNNKPVVIILPSEGEVDATHTFLKSFFDVEIFPGIEDTPYSSFYQSESALQQRFKVFDKISDNEKFIILCSIDSFLLKNPPIYFFKENKFNLAVDDIISPEELSKQLISIGYSHSATVEEPGTFSRKGEIFDIFSNAHGPIRLHYFDDLIEHIFKIDAQTQKTLKNSPLKKIELEVSPQTLVKEKYRLTLMDKLPHFGPANRDLFEKRKEISKSLNEGRLFENYVNFVPLFFDNPCSLSQLTFENHIFPIFYNENEVLENKETLFESLNEVFNEEVGLKNTILPSPENFFDLNFENDYQLINKKLIISPLDISINLDGNIENEVALNIQDFNVYLRSKVKDQTQLSTQLSKVKIIIDVIANQIKNFKQVNLFIKNEYSKNEINHLIELNYPNSYQAISSKINYVIGNLAVGFIYKNEDVLFISESDLFTRKTSKAKVVRRDNSDLFADQLSTLEKGDFVVHKDYGIGEYLGLETLDFTGLSSDFVVIKYQDDDKVYVPVYKLDVIQKYSDSSSDLKVASLKSGKFSNLKNKVRSSVKKLAFDLLKLQAKRKSSKGFQFSKPDDIYFDFEKTFPFQETPDQKSTIDEVLEDMQRPSAMDRLVCGDVGFGKTEVAMRAAFKAVLDKKQVAVLVPTTVLSLQHYNSFVERFKSFPINIDFLSRFKSKTEADETIQNLEEGKVDIIIGTHKLLSSKIKFHDLGLVIVDEEHRFGVAHKEKFKLLKENVDFLTLTATPIPRTLQLSFLGIRDLSIIKTAPPKRKSIKSYIIKEDPLTIKNAVQKELNRGGQAFIVHNRVHDIDNYASKIRELVPEANICVAHGQMSEKQLESKIRSFYQGQYNILLSTTIIESGIDIPNANTMIIDRADTFGLAQLHQLRGRIGRSDKKAYAYFVIPNERKLTDTASKRLQALKKYADIGSGFSLASSDLEIRGAGDILGPEQSGHIENIGLELYMQLLKEAIQDLKGEVVESFSNVEIHTSYPSFIPQKYINNSAQRLKFYKRLSNASSNEALDNVFAEIQDMYGISPSEVENLVLTLKSRLNFSKSGVLSVKVTGKQVKLIFNKELLGSNEALRNNIVDYFMSSKKRFQLKPDYSVLCSFKDKVDLNTLLNFSFEVHKELVAS